MSSPLVCCRGALYPLVRREDLDNEGSGPTHLNLFHHQCIRTIVGVLRQQQWETHVTSSALAKTLGVPEGIGLTIRERRLRWLGHMARTEDHQLPKCVPFGELPAPCPAQGPCKRLRDIVVDDFASVETSVPACG